MSDIVEYNTIKLVELRAQISELATIVDAIIVSNLRAATKLKLEAAASVPSNAPLSQEVRDLLALAGGHGMTCRELIEVLSPKRDAPYNTVRMALNRMRDAGQARKAGHRWYATS